MFSNFYKKNLTFISFCSLLFNFNSYASTSLTVSGYAGLVGQYSLKLPPESSTYSAFRVPVGLLLQASPTDNFNAYLGLDYAYANYPKAQILLGNTNDTSTTNAKELLTPMPFANAVNGSTIFGQKTDSPTLTQAYFSYQNSFGLLRAGRMPRHWGLGIWYNSDWKPEGSGLSTTDAVALTEDFGLFDTSVYIEKYGESVAGFSKDADATAYTIEAHLKTDPNDPPSTGISRDIGFTYSRFSHKASHTKINIIDVYSKFYFPKLFIGAEFLFPSGNTQNPNYQTLGGLPECTGSVPGVAAGNACVEQDLSALGALLKTKYLLTSTSNEGTIYGVEKSQKMLGTTERQDSQYMEFWTGYASGGSNQFNKASATSTSPNKISAIRLNANIQPALLMFNNTLPLINGMPTASITNTTFARLSYTIESPSWGQFTSALITGRLNKLNPIFATCTPTAFDPSSPINNFCTGGSKNLGVELDLKYAYTTMDRVTASLESGYWMVGNAWKKYGQSTIRNSLGARATISTVF